mmetsp:Transcript_6295/g.13797  ORF Transcript_6295/g.13797 Transcript_6295/m.13797 type:complete len:142 (+) Transcript_6295:104-529(+)|eukprot:CAMPEP_0178432434 /NCGR_PEP_ID=MMETSP0689_2-20121128/32378_1 /TAXON_ID=160604 /ORGANISM="Amphidinium massartii, Strain CS-259" /LENGTH=141 /DNA_ID=CAMNT_0020054411 /DNA_START=93 /DNA_END=518 /DNA_ORIENTATION=-
MAYNPVPLTQFQEQQYDVTAPCDALCCVTNLITLTPEEMLIDTTAPCGATHRRIAYGELGDIATSTNACGHVTLSSSNAGFMLDSGCCGSRSEQNEEIYHELKQRVAGRGDAGQVVRQEMMKTQLDRIESKLDRLIAQQRM